MRIYVIEVAMQTEYAPEVHETMLELIKDTAQTLNLQTEMINKSPLNPTVEAHWMDSIVGDNIEIPLNSNMED